MATFRVCCDSSERRSGPGTSGCAVAASASVLRGKGLRISSDRDLYHAHGSWSGSGVGNRESHRRKSRMVEISLSGSGEGPGRVTSRPTLQHFLRHHCYGLLDENLTLVSCLPADREEDKPAQAVYAA